MEGKANRQRRIHEMTGVLFGQSKGLRDLSHTRPAWVLLKIIPNTPPIHPGLYSPPPSLGKPPPRPQVGQGAEMAKGTSRTLSLVSLAYFKLSRLS